jgi:hypothetical protein
MMQKIVLEFTLNTQKYYILRKKSMNLEKKHTILRRSLFISLTYMNTVINKFISSKRNASTGKNNIIMSRKKLSLDIINITPLKEKSMN